MDVQNVINQLTDDEKYRLVTGRGLWHTYGANGKLPEIHLSDGPHGMRCQDDGVLNIDSFEATCFPTASCAACSFDPKLTGMMGEAIAKEAIEEKVSVVLGPGTNMKRSPLCGRNFEYYSEDPYLAGKLAASFIKNVEKNNVGTSLKHFAGNSQETHRMISNSMIDERTLREIYLSAFEIAVKEGKPATLMGSYNRLNGTYACENKHLLTEILRDEWGYEGAVISDWGACTDLPACIEAGLDLEMPDSNGCHFESIKKAVEEGAVSKESFDRAINKVASMALKYKVEGERPALKKGENSYVNQTLRKQNHQLAAKIAQESAVLLKNDGFLPLEEKSEVLIIGELATKPRFQGGGSSHIHTDHVSDLRSILLDMGMRPKFVKGYRCDSEEPSKALEEEALLEAARASQHHIPVLFFGGLTDRSEGEGYDRLTFELPENQKHLLKILLGMIPDLGVVSFGGTPYNIAPMDDARAILQMYLGGEGVMMACARLLTGRAVPCGKLAETWPLEITDTPCYNFYGKQNPNVDDVEYREGLFIGYRYYDTFDKPVKYPFGYGLSYVTFRYDNLKLERDGNNLIVCADIKNEGAYPAKEIVQVYVKNPDNGFLRAKRELRGFKKVALKPGETKTVKIPVEERAFQVFADCTMNTEKTGYVTVAGEYEIQVGASLADIRLRESVMIEGDAISGNAKVPAHIPMTREEFDAIYTYERFDFTNPKVGEFDKRNSLAQMAKYSLRAKMILQGATTALRMKCFPKTADDPEVIMWVEGLHDAPVDSIPCQSGGLVSESLVRYLIEDVNRRAK